MSTVEQDDLRRFVVRASEMLWGVLEVCGQADLESVRIAPAEIPDRTGDLYLVAVRGKNARLVRELVGAAMKAERVLSIEIVSDPRTDAPAESPGKGEAAGRFAVGQQP